MKLLLLVALLTAGTTAHSISPRAVWKYGNVFRCTTPLVQCFKGYNFFCWYCVSDGWKNQMEDVDRCCQIQDNCYAQVNNVKNCKFRLGNQLRKSYSYSCSGAVVTCSDENDACEDAICNCDRQAAICFSKSSYSKGFYGDYC